MANSKKDFDVVFNDDYDSSSKGFSYSISECKTYIDTYNGTNESYFKDFKGGNVAIVNNTTGEEFYSEEVY